MARESGGRRDDGGGGVVCRGMLTFVSIETSRVELPSGIDGVVTPPNEVENSDARFD
jgi:hypothetical protein